MREDLDRDSDSRRLVHLKRFQYKNNLWNGKEKSLSKAPKIIFMRSLINYNDNPEAGTAKWPNFSSSFLFPFVANANAQPSLWCKDSDEFEYSIKLEK